MYLAAKIYLNVNRLTERGGEEMNEKNIWDLFIFVGCWHAPFAWTFHRNATNREVFLIKQTNKKTTVHIVFNQTRCMASLQMVTAGVGGFDSAFFYGFALFSGFNIIDQKGHFDN